MSKEKVIGFEYNQGVRGTHPKTGQPMPPPMVMSAIVDDGSYGWARAAMVRVNDSMGWYGEFFERPLWEGEGDG